MVLAGLAPQLTMRLEDDELWGLGPFLKMKSVPIFVFVYSELYLSILYLKYSRAHSSNLFRGGIL